jgi:hypothetical protein
MQELKVLRKELRKVHGSMVRVAQKSQKSICLVRLVLRGIRTNEAVQNAALIVLKENKAILELKQQQKNQLAQKIILELETN